jgi:sugar transferase (PEP-CTERM system associated)
MRRHSLQMGSRFRSDGIALTQPDPGHLHQLETPELPNPMQGEIHMKSIAQFVQGIDSIPARITTVRFFSGHVHRLAVLGMVEAAVVFLAVYAAILIRFPSEGLASAEATQGWIFVRGLLAAGATLLALASMGLYALRQRARFRGVVARLLIAVLMAAAALGLISYLMPSLFVGRGVVAMIGAFSFVGLALVRYGYLRLVDEDIFKLRVLVWGAGMRAATIANTLRRRTDQRGFRILGYVVAPGDEIQVSPAEILEQDGDLMSFVLRHRVEEIVEAMDDRRRGFPEAFLRDCRLRGIAVRDIVGFLERESGRVSVELAQPSWFIYSEGFRSDVFRLAVKRVFDICVSAFVLVFAAPIGLLTAIAIFLEDRGPIFYTQVRTGQNGRPFRMLKFRSMASNAEPDGTAVWARRNDPRVTRVGAFIRKVRIDELPQVLNVLLGNMSFVGPRPERPLFVEALRTAIPFYAERHYVKPGITGWAQVCYPYGASESDARKKLGYDLYYVAHHSLAFDLMVLLQTVEIVVLRTGSR